MQVVYNGKYKMRAHRVLAVLVLGECVCYLEKPYRFAKLLYFFCAFAKRTKQIGLLYNKQAPTPPCPGKLVALGKGNLWLF